MVLACGATSPEFAMFHLVNHSFFKALLFLSAGAIIHALRDEQDIRRMGSLVNFLPFSYLGILVGSIALMGFPFLTGFYSKEGIIILALSNGPFAKFSYILGLVSVITTIIYSVRLLFLTFYIEPNTFRQTVLNLHEAPFLMLLSMTVLIIGSVFFGFFSQDFFIGFGSDALGHSVSKNLDFFKPDFEFTSVYIKLIPFILVLVCPIIYLYLNITYENYYYNTITRNIINFLNNRWNFDYLYSKLITNPAIYAGEWYTLYTWDRGFLEVCGPRGLAKSTKQFVMMTQGAHTGYLSLYIAYILTGVLAFLYDSIYHFTIVDGKVFLVGLCSYIFIRKYTFNFK